MIKTTLVGLFALASLAVAQSPLSSEAKTLYGLTKNNILKSAEKMPEENYAFKPTPEVRSYGQLIGHVADAQYLFCSAVKGEKHESSVEKTATTKAALVEELKSAFSYCDAVYDSMKDSDAATKIKFFGNERSKLTVLNFNMGHNFEHYGNIVTYLRLKGIVPPSSEGR
jgi:uncharacterized damage-inducible protein DinB